METSGLAKKLTNRVLFATATGLCLTLCIYVALVLEDVPAWGSESQHVMREQEGLNINRLAVAKADHIGEIFARVKENLLQLQAWGEQILLIDPETVVVDGHVDSFSGLQQHPVTWNYSSWYISGYTSETVPPAPGDSLDGLLNRSALMDVPFRGMQRQEVLMYLAALDDPSLPDDPDTSVAFQAYPAYDMLDAGFTTYNDEEDCDDRFDTGDNDFSPSTYDPRCRVWFQDARASNEPIFTDPYQDWGSGLLTVTPAAAVYNGTVLLGVVGIDMDFTVIDQSIVSLSVLDGEGYAYLLAPTGVVAAHPDLDPTEAQSILDLEPGVDEDEFGTLLDIMIDECSGTASYSKNGKSWLISWKHETASGSGGYGGLSSDGASVGCPGFIVVVTISEATLLGVFSETEAGIHQTVMVASILMAFVMIVIACVTAWLARSLSDGMTKPVLQLVDVVRALNNMDFSQQDPGLWMLNDVSCPEVEELMDAFKTMTTVVKFANVSLESGNVEAAHKSYTDALILFKKLKNDRGVAVVYNNLGNVYTLQARALSKNADANRQRGSRAADQIANDLTRKANARYEDAVASFRLAIEDADMLVSWGNQEKPDPGELVGRPRMSSTARTMAATGADSKEQDNSDQGYEASDKAKGDPLHVAEAQEAQVNNNDSGIQTNDTPSPESAAALKLQLANRKFNLALCLVAKTTGVGDSLEKDEAAPREREEARRLINECEALASERNDALGCERQVEYLLALAALERSQPGRIHQATRALERADEIIATAGGLHPPAAGASAVPDHPAANVATVPLAILRQRVLAARGEERLAAGDINAAVGYWTEAVVCCSLLDPGAVRTSLVGLQKQVCSLGDAQDGGNPYAMALARGLGLSKEGKSIGNRVVSNSSLTKRIQAEIQKLDRSAAFGTDTVKVDLCFVMDCTGSMGRWINQAKKKLFAIIEQTKKDIQNLELRVAYIGYRDFKDQKHYEGPYDFHSEEQLPQLEAKLSGIIAGGGPGYVADVAGGIKHATELSWSSPVRVCILFADAPCHGKKYHDQRDPNPEGCPRGVDPAKMIYKLLYELDVDFYFIRIASVTDKMVSIFQNTVRQMAANKKKKASSGSDFTPKFVVHNLGSNDNRFVDTVVGSVIGSAGINLRMEKYA